MSTEQKEFLTLELEGTKITSDKFLRAANHFFGLIKNVTEDVAGIKDALSWLVSLKEGSLQIVARPEPNIAQKDIVHTVVRTIDRGIAQIEKSNIRPAHFSDNALKHLRDLASVISVGDGDIQHIRVRRRQYSHIISHHSVANVKIILSPSRKADGSVEGRVALISDRKGFRVYVDDVLTGYGVRCILSENNDKLESELIAAFRKRVIVFGTVHYRQDGEPVSIEVEEIRVLGTKDELPNFEDVRGILE